MTDVLNFKLMSRAQCTALLRACASMPSTEGRLYGDREGRGQGFTVDPTRYRARERFLDLQAPLVWLRAVLQTALDRGAAAYGYAALRQYEMPRVLTYGPGSHFDWHVDAFPGAAPAGRPTRRLTASILLSGGDEFCGGDLQVKRGDQEWFASRERGDVAMFPAECLHKVSPIESGCRVALVMWGY